jgi:hypothetical protein
MRDSIQEVLLWQTEYSSKGTDAMKRRGDVVKTELANELRELLPELAARAGVDDLRVQGKDGSGSRTEIPWTRIYSQSRSPSATAGWYLVFLFSAAGDRAYLSLNQGTTQWDAGGWRPRPLSDLSARTAWARKVLATAAPLPPPWTTEMQLDNRVSELGTLYELGNVVAVEYPIDNVPPDNQIEADLLVAASWLGTIYGLGDEGLYVPGNSPEVADAVAALDAIGRPRMKRPRLRLTAAENKAIEQHAVELVCAHFTALDYDVTDVGSTEAYDVHATKADQIVKIEVKGTTSDGSDVTLTANEVTLHQSEYPNNAFAVVRDIRLSKNGDQPTPTGGELVLEMPWKLDPDRLQPMAYRYRTGL